jgi:hypothetical protein
MPIQKGTHRLTGTMGELTYFKGKEGYEAKEKGGVPASRIATSDRFVRTRENGAEFGRGGKAVKLIRQAFSQLVKDAADGRSTSRLVQRAVRALKSDPTSARGERLLSKGDLTLLQGFDFNVNAVLTSTFLVPYTVTIDRPGGHLTVNIPSFVPSNGVVQPKGATHCKIVCGGAEIDFDKNLYTSNLQETADLPIDKTATAAISLVSTVTANSTLPLFLVLGVDFSQEINGIMYPLLSGGFNALAIVNVSKS